MIPTILSSIVWRGKEDEVAVGVFDDEGLGLPGLGAQGLGDWDVCGLIGAIELIDFVGGGERDGGGEQVLAFANVCGEDGLVRVA